MRAPQGCLRSYRFRVSGTFWIACPFCTPELAGSHPRGYPIHSLVKELGFPPVSRRGGGIVSSLPLLSTGCRKKFSRHPNQRFTRVQTHKWVMRTSTKQARSRERNYKVLQTQQAADRMSLPPQFTHRGLIRRRRHENQPVPQYANRSPNCQAQSVHFSFRGLALTIALRRR